MGPTFLPALEMRGPSRDLKGPALKQLSHLKYAYASVTTENLSAALDHLATTFGQLETLLNVTSVSSEDDILALLDAGAAQVFVNSQQSKSLALVENLDQKRLVLSVKGAQPKVLEQLCETVRGPLHLPDVRGIDVIKSCVCVRGHDDGPVYVTVDGFTAGSALQVAKIKAVPIVPAEMVSFGPPIVPDAVDASQLLLAGAVSDRPDGLFTTLVADERGTALGLVYSSRQSVAESLRLGRGVYHSRKRGLWYKGDTSGDIQELVNVSFDCDSDCLYFTVKQLGRGMLLDDSFALDYLLTDFG